MAGAAGEGFEVFVDGFEAAFAVPHWLEGGALEKSAVEKGWEDAALGDEVVLDRACTGGFAHGGHLGWVAADEVDVVLRPLEGGALVPETGVRKALLFHCIAGHEAECADAVV